MHTGKIKAVYKNHGIINCEVDDHSVNVLFFIFPDMKQKSKKNNVFFKICVYIFCKYIIKLKNL